MSRQPGGNFPRFRQLVSGNLTAGPPCWLRWCEAASHPTDMAHGFCIDFPSPTVPRLKASITVGFFTRIVRLIVSIAVFGKIIGRFSFLQSQNYLFSIAETPVINRKIFWFQSHMFHHFWHGSRETLKTCGQLDCYWVWLKMCGNLNHRPNTELQNIFEQPLLVYVWLHR